MTPVHAADGNAPPPEMRSGGLLIYAALGAVFGIVLVKSEVVSWFRIQEMFRFQAFHMYGIIGSALAVAAGSVAMLKHYRVTALGGEPIDLPSKEMGRGYRYWIGGAIFGLGWALTGACPGPLFALLGAGVTVIAIGIISAIGGTWLYGYLRPSLPH
jgi:uncharacterized membrane protein YedE/YeeE